MEVFCNIVTGRQVLPLARFYESPDALTVWLDKLRALCTQVSWVNQGQLSKAHRIHGSALMKAAISMSFTQAVAGWDTLNTALQDHPDVIAAYSDPVNVRPSCQITTRMLQSDFS